MFPKYLRPATPRTGFRPRHLKRFIVNPGKIITFLGRHEFLNRLPDEYYLKLAYNAHTGKNLCLENPRTYNEKLQWLKLHDHNPLYTRLVDKWEVKKYVAERLGHEYVIPNLGIWNNYDEIDFDQLPDRFVMKCTHDSGSVLICRDKNSLDKNNARHRTRKALSTCHFWSGREWPYRNIKPRLFAETYLEPSDSETLKNYKFFCFGGEPRYILTVDAPPENGGAAVRRLYDREFRRCEFGSGDPGTTDSADEKPDTLEQMLRTAEILSSGLRHVRVDLYTTGGRVFFGEMTFYHMSGWEKFIPESWDVTLGALLDLQNQVPLRQ